MLKRVEIPDNIRLLTLVAIQLYQVKAFYPLPILFIFGLWKVADAITDWLLKFQAIENIKEERDPEDDDSSDSDGSDIGLDSYSSESIITEADIAIDSMEILGNTTPDPA